MSLALSTGSFHNLGTCLCLDKEKSASCTGKVVWIGTQHLSGDIKSPLCTSKVT